MLSILINRLLHLFSTKAQSRRGGLSKVRTVPILLETLEQRAMLSSAPIVTVPPKSQTVNDGQLASFTAAASGSPTSFQWQVSTDNGLTYNDIPGATSIPLNFIATAGDNGKYYRIEFTNGLGTTASPAAKLTVQTAPVVTTNPLGQTVNSGQPVTFTAAATGNPTPIVQWQVSANGGGIWSNIPGATSNTLTLTATTTLNNNQYRAVYKNNVGSANSAAATLVVNSVPKITVQPTSQSAAPGSTVTFISAASGTPTPTVKWQVSTDNSVTYNDVPGATSPTLSFTVQQSQSKNLYRAVYTNTIGSTTTAAAKLVALPVVTSNPQSQTGVNGQPVTFTVTVSGTPTPIVQWQVSTDLGVTFQNIPGATSTSYTVTASFRLANNRYRVMATSPDAPTRPVYSAAATLSITNPASAPVITLQPTSQFVEVGNTVGFFATATGTPAATVQWQISTDGGQTFTNVAGATSNQYTFVATVAHLNQVYYYRAVFTNSAGQTTTNVVSYQDYTFSSKPEVTADPEALTVDSGDVATFTSTATGGALTGVQWQVSADGAKTWVDIPGATNQTFNGGFTVATYSFVASTAQHTFQYRAVFTNFLGKAVSAPATLTVNGDPVIVLNPTDQAVPIGASVTFTANAGGNPVPTAQWQQSIDGGATWTDIASATQFDYTFTTAAGQSGYKYRAKFTSNSIDVFTTAATLTLLTVPTITINPIDQVVTVGQTVSFTVGFTANPAATVQWLVSTDGGTTFNPIPGATSATYSFVPTQTQDGNRYEAVVTNSVGPVTSTAATLTVLPVPSAPQITSNPAPQSLLNGQTATFNVAFISNPAATVQWQVSTNNGATYTNLAGQTSTTLSFATVATQNGYLYRAVVTNAIGSATSGAAKLTVAPLLITQNPLNQVVFAGQTVTFSATALGNPIPTVQWQISTDNGATFSNIAGATSTTQNPDGSTTANYSFVAALSQTGNVYRAIFTNAAGTRVTSAATLNVVSGAQAITVNPSSQSIAVGKTVTFSAASRPKDPTSVNPASLPTVAVQWQISTNGGKTFSNIVGATSASLTVGVSAALNGNQYRATFKAGSTTTTTTAATLTALTAPTVTTQPSNVTASKNQSITLTAAATANPTPKVQWQVSTDGGKTYTNISGATSTTLKLTVTAKMNGYLYRAVFSNSVASNVLSKAAKLTVI